MNERTTAPATLVVVKSFPPLRTEPNTARLLKYLGRLAPRIDVLHALPGRGAATGALTRDDDLAAQLPPTVHRHPVSVANPLRGLKNLLRGGGGNAELGTRRRRISPLGRLYRSLLFMPDADYFWVWPAVLHGLRLLKKLRPRVLVTSGPPFSTHLAGWVLKRLTGVPWVGHFRDLYTANPLYVPWSAWRAAFDRALERRVIGAMDAVTTVYPETTALLERRCGRPGQRYLTVRNGYDEAVFSELPQPADGREAPPERLSLVHGGKLLADDADGQTAHRLLAALAELLERRPELRSTVRLTLVGKVHPSYRRVVDELGLQETVTIEPPVTNREMIARTLAADINLVILEDSPRNMATTGGKIYECLRAGRPILGIMHPRCSAARLIRGLNAGRVAPYRDTTAISRVLEQLVDDLGSGGFTYGGPERDAFVTRTSFEHLAERFAEVLNSSSRESIKG